MHASIYTLGCRLNQADSALIADDLERHGFTIVPWGQPADLLVVNSCAVTGTAVQKSRQIINGARKRCPGATIVLCGCAAMEPALIGESALEKIDFLVGNPKPDSLVELMSAQRERGGGKVVSRSWQPEGFTVTGCGSYSARTRANLKIQEGCDFRCSYCIVPDTRGPAVSRDLRDTIREAAELIAAGHRELVITGVNVATYRNSGKDLAGLLEEILAIPGDFRLRLGSVEPGPVLDNLIELMAREPRICRFLHLPLQYGEDTILKRMRRHYDCAKFAAAANYAAERVPGICIGTDIMVGFPGENDAIFQRCREFVESMPFGLMHVFSYSPRPGTPAAAWERPSARDAAFREGILLEIAAAKARDFALSQCGQQLRVLMESGAGKAHGWTDNYLKAVFDSQDAPCPGTLCNCVISGVLPGSEREVSAHIEE